MVTAVESLARLVAVGLVRWQQRHILEGVEDCAAMLHLSLRQTAGIQHGKVRELGDGDARPSLPLPRSISPKQDQSRRRVDPKWRGVFVWWFSGSQVWSCLPAQAILWHEHMARLWEFSRNGSCCSPTTGAPNGRAPRSGRAGGAARQRPAGENHAPGHGPGRDAVVRFRARRAAENGAGSRLGVAERNPASAHKIDACRR